MHRISGLPERHTGHPDEANRNESVTIAVTDGNGCVAYWSREAQELLGYTPAEIIGSPLAELFATDGTTFRHRDGSLLDTVWTRWRCSSTRAVRYSRARAGTASAGGRGG
ncbi:hypothetical protein GCM10010304_01640 [Streptomyces roseoviolaceus]